MKKALIILLSIILLTSCGEPAITDVPTDAKPTAVLTVYYPDTTVTMEVYDLTTGSNTERVYWTDMDGVDHNTTLRTKVDYKYGR